MDKITKFGLCVSAAAYNHYKLKSSQSQTAFIVNQQDYDMLCLRVNQLDYEVNKLKSDSLMNNQAQSNINQEVLKTLKSQGEINQTLIRNFQSVLSK